MATTLTDGPWSEGATSNVGFEAEIEGQKIHFMITHDTLYDDFGKRGQYDSYELIELFELLQDQILERAVNLSGEKPVQKGHRKYVMITRGAGKPKRK